MTRYQTATLLILATAQAAAPAAIEWLDLEIGGSGGPRITPAGYAFVVWGVIVVLALGYTLLQACKADPVLAPLSRAIAWPLALVYTGFVLWLLAAVNNWLVATVAIFVAMYFLLRRVYLLIVPWRSSLTWPYRVLLEAQVGIYLGWTSIAIFANLAAALTFYGLDETGVFWQAAILIAAVGNGLYGIHYTAASPAYTATVLWAFLGVLIGLMAYEDTRLLQGLAVAAILAVLGTWVRRRSVGTRTPALPSAKDSRGQFSKMTK
jgi:hypothetical protein